VLWQRQKKQSGKQCDHGVSNHDRPVTELNDAAPCERCGTGLAERSGKILHGGSGAAFFFGNVVHQVAIDTGSAQPLSSIERKEEDDTQRNHPRRNQQKQERGRHRLRQRYPLDCAEPSV
jgi:hypothetical protein